MANLTPCDQMRKTAAVLLNLSRYLERNQLIIRYRSGSQRPLANLIEIAHEGLTIPQLLAKQSVDLVAAADKQHADNQKTERLTQEAWAEFNKIQASIQRLHNGGC